MWIALEINISKNRTSNICLVVVNEFLSFLLGVKNKKLGILEKKYAGRRRQNLARTDRASYYKQEQWLEEFLYDKATFYNGSENDDSENDDENYNEKIEAVARGCYSK